MIRPRSGSTREARRRSAIASNDARRDQPLRVERVVEPERLESARDAVPQVQPDEQHADDVERDPERLTGRPRSRSGTGRGRRASAASVPGAELELLHVHDHEDSMTRPDQIIVEDATLLRLVWPAHAFFS